MITGKTLIEWGFDPKGKGKWFGTAIEDANAMRRIGKADHAIIRELKEREPQLPPEMPAQQSQALKPCKKNPSVYCNCEGFYPACCEAPASAESEDIGRPVPKHGSGP